MIVTNDFEVRVGARTLLNAPGQHLRVQPGDRIGLVGRNGAGKTTTMRILAGETQPYGGSVIRSGDIGYLPQDSREGNIDQTARDRVLSARGLDQIQASMERQQEIMETTEDEKNVMLRSVNTRGWKSAIMHSADMKLPQKPREFAIILVCQHEFWISL